MNLLAQNQPRDKTPGRKVTNLTDRPEQDAPYYAHWYAANREAVLERMRISRAAKRDEINVARRAKYAANPAKYKRRAAKLYRENARTRNKAIARASARYYRIKAEREAA